MVATGRIDIHAEARVTGRVLAPRFMLAEGAAFNGPRRAAAPRRGSARGRATGRSGTTEDAATPPVKLRVVSPAG